MNPDSTRSLFADMHALAQGGSGGEAAFASATPELGPVLLKLALGLIAVIVLILLLQRIARRFGGGLPRRGDPIQLLAQKPLGPRLSLAVVEVMDRTLLVGVSPHGVQRVADLTASRARQRARDVSAFPGLPRPGELRSAGSPGASWKDRVVSWLARLLSGERRAPAESSLDGSGAASAPPGPASGFSGVASGSLVAQAKALAAAGAAAPAESGFETEFRRRLEEIQARYPQIAELETKPIGGTAP
jgi:flagellar protein FliO/FliZ